MPNNPYHVRLTISQFGELFRAELFTEDLGGTEGDLSPVGSGHAIRAHLVKQSGPTWVTSRYPMTDRADSSPSSRLLDLWTVRAHSAFRPFLAFIDSRNR